MNIFDELRHSNESYHSGKSRLCKYNEYIDSLYLYKPFHQIKQKGLWKNQIFFFILNVFMRNKFIHRYIRIMFSKKFVLDHKVSLAILLFLFVFATIHMIKPDLIYDKDGVFRPFGVGYRNKTIFPIWLISIILAIFSYLSICVFISLYYDI